MAVKTKKSLYKIKTTFHLNCKKERGQKGKNNTKQNKTLFLVNSEWLYFRI